MNELKGKVAFITGASRGIGRAIAVRLAQEGASIVLAAKTGEPNPKLPGTVYDAAEEVEAAGGRALPCIMDVRFEDQVDRAVQETIATFGQLDILVNNASAISLTGTLATPVKRFDLMHAVNVRGTFLCSQKCLPHLQRASNPHILNLAPPLHMESRWFAPHVAYTLSKYGMSMCVLGMSEEFRPQGIAVNALWPRTAIATAAVRNLLGGEAAIRGCRTPQIVADAAYHILTRDSRQQTGQFCIDEDVLRQEGVDDFSSYAVDPSAALLPDLFL